MDIIRKSIVIQTSGTRTNGTFGLFSDILTVMFEMMIEK
jgi:hypothetical protein